MKLLPYVIVFFFLNIIFSQASASLNLDSIPPVVTSIALSQEAPCDENKVIEFQNWYNNAGGFEAMDDSGDYAVNATIPLNVGIDSVLAGSEESCGDNVFIEIGFFAIDSCENHSDTSYAFFTTFDIVKPDIIVQAQDKFINCDFGATDSLENWLQSYASAEAFDICSDVFWEDYIWNDSEGNNGFGNLNEETEIEILRENCTWFVNVSFFVRDGCENVSVTTGRFTVDDNLAPVVLPLPIDLTVQCDNVPSLASYLVQDGCDGDIPFSIQEVSTQNDSIENCSHYNYELFRTWSFEDACGNTDTVYQHIVVIDTLGPKVDFQNSISVSCTADLNEIELFINPLTECGEVEISFEDGPLNNNVCIDEFDREWTLTDICGNVSNFTQNIQLQDFELPEIISAPQELIISCNDLGSVEFLVNIWIDSMAFASVIDGCTELSFFTATPESYDVNDPVTFPGTPFQLNFNDVCLERANGTFLEQQIDFVFFDGCGNAVSSPTMIRVTDDTQPIFIDCPEDLQIQLNENDCIAQVDLSVPEARDNCLSFPTMIRDTSRQSVISNDPENPNILVDTVCFELGPYGLDIDPNRIPSLTFNLQNLDINSPEEFFIISIEGVVVDTTPIIQIECGDTLFVIDDISPFDWLDWIEDGIIEIKCIPNIPIQDVLGINDVCPDSYIEITTELFLIETLSLDLSFSLNGEESIPLDPDQNILSIDMQPGENIVVFSALDCGGNNGVCETLVQLTDIFPPEISCPQDQSFTIETGECNAIVSLSPDFVFSDNCLGSNVLEFTEPSNPAEALLMFIEQQDGSLSADDAIVDFTIPPFMGQLFNPSIQLLYLADFSNGGSFEILSEDGLVLFSSAGNSCAFDQSQTFIIDEQDFLNWSMDGTVQFTVRTAGIVGPCDNVDDAGFDGESFIQIYLNYQEILPIFEITGDTILQGDFTDLNTTPEVDFGPGNYAILYQVSDQSGNTAVCEYNIIIEDKEAPTISCIDAATVQIHPSGLEDYEITSDEFIPAFNDNCGEVELSFSPPLFTCDDVGTDKLVTAYAQDQFDNIDSCSFIISVRQFELELGFSSGLCIGDSLILFSNIPDPPITDAYQFSWTGPNGFISNDQEPFIISPDASYSGTYILNVQGFSECITTASIEVLVEQLSDPFIELSDPFVCVGESILLSTNSFTGDVVYKWYEGLPPDGIEIQQSSGPAIELTPVQGDHQYYAIVEGLECNSNPSQVVEVSVVDKPLATVADLFINVCIGEAILFSSTVFDPNYMYNWVGPDGYLGSGQFPEGIDEATESNEGSYSLFIEDSGCFSDTTSFEVTVFSNPEKPIITGQNLICEGSTFFLSVSNITNADQYIWYKDGVLFNTINNTNSIMVEDAQSSLSGAWQVVIRDGICSSGFSDPYQVSVEADIPIGASNEGPICEGDSLQLNATFIPDANYLWTSPTGENFTGQKPKVLAFEGEYTVTVTSENGCANSASTFVDINDAPEITSLSNNAPACLQPNTNIQFFVTIFPEGDYMYEWTGPNFSSNDPNPVIFNASPFQNGVYTLQVFNESCASAAVSTTVNMVVSPLPIEIFTVEESCEGDNITIETNYANENNCEFEWQTPGGIITNDEGVLSILNANINDGGEYTVRVEKQGCMSEVSDPYFLEINAIPSPPGIIGTDEICEGSTIVLEAITNAESVVWQGPNGFTSQVEILEIPNATSDNEGVYTVMATNGLCFSEASEAFFVNIKDIPKMPELGLNVDTICLSSAANWQYCLEGSELDSFDQISIWDASVDTLIGYFEDSCIVINTLPWEMEDISFYLRGEKFDCQSLASENILLHIFDDIAFEASIGAEDVVFVCDTILFDLQALNTSDEIDIVWSSNSDDIYFTLANNEFTDVKIRALGSFQIFLETFHPRCGLISSDTIEIILDEFVTAADDVFFMELNDDQFFEFIQNDFSESDFNINILTSFQQVEWSLEGNGIRVNSGNRFIGQDLMIYEICSQDCPDLCSQAWVTLFVGGADDCFVSNVLTPNGDGFNDKFEVPCLNTDSYLQNKLIVFNQWGDEVYSASPYFNDWEGTYNGEPLPAGTYFYILEFNDDIPTVQGFIVLHE